ncbi:MAG TPA: AbrB/MazE/SpoVT family DNA-binding domain-containing protein [Burkholderiaceae bacterium]|nr:AbrB/MazE/SpoVT family DNA-binding domain-containing protein [Burkholderiaceae bacterium]
MAAMTRLSSKGQVVIPKEFRDAMDWRPGDELIVTTTESGILLRSARREAGGLRLEDLRGFIGYKGPSISTEELCRPVDYGAHDEEPEQGLR